MAARPPFGGSGGPGGTSGGGGGPRRRGFGRQQPHQHCPRHSPPALGLGRALGGRPMMPSSRTRLVNNGGGAGAMVSSSSSSGGLMRGVGCLGVGGLGARLRSLGAAALASSSSPPRFALAAAVVASAAGEAGAGGSDASSSSWPQLPGRRRQQQGGDNDGGNNSDASPPPLTPKPAKPKSPFDFGSPLRRCTDAILVLTALTFVAQWLTRDNITVWGAKVNSLIWPGGQWWRLLTPALLHSGALHLLINSHALHTLGPHLEAVAGGARLCATYVVSAVTGTALSVALTPAPSVGASASIFGVGAALAVFYQRHRDRLGARAEGVLKSLGIALLINLAYAAANRRVDTWGHVGGALGGALTAWLLGPRLVEVGSGEAPAHAARLLKNVWGAGRVGGGSVTVVSVPSQPAQIVALPAQGPIIAPPVIVGTAPSFVSYPVGYPVGGGYPCAGPCGGYVGGGCGGGIVGCGGGGIYATGYGYPAYGRRLKEWIVGGLKMTKK